LERTTASGNPSDFTLHILKHITDLIGWHAAPHHESRAQALASTLQSVPSLFHNHGMERIDRHRLAELVEIHSPGWARVGLAMPDPDLRRRAADAIAGVILDAIDTSPLPDPRQLPLEL
jgi:hypothetical protein